MRSANDAINAAATVLVIGVYVLGFCGIGLFFMIRQRWVLWRQAALWAVFIALLMGLQVLNAWPLAWMDYDTALPAEGFAIRQVMTAIATFGALGVLLTISFIAAETLTQAGVSASGAIVEDLVASGVLIQYDFGTNNNGIPARRAFLCVRNRSVFFRPGEARLVDAVGHARQSRHVRELRSCAVRRIAGTAGRLLGGMPFSRGAAGNGCTDRRPIRQTPGFIAAAMLLQALVFAAGHAGYANQPAYARVVELIIPSFAFGLLYLLFGLSAGNRFAFRL